MRIIVNGDPHETNAETVETLLGELGLDRAVVATALNGELVTRTRRAETPVAQGDRLDVLAPMGGG